MVNSFLDATVYLSALVVVTTKLLDCWSTWIRIGAVKDEMNGLARVLMEKIGIWETITVIFVIEIVVVAISLWMLYLFFNSVLVKLPFIFTASFVASVQLAVAQSNYTKRPNVISKSAGMLLRRLKG